MFYYKNEQENGGIYLDGEDGVLSIIVTEYEYNKDNNEAMIKLSRSEVQKLHDELGKFLKK